MKANFSIFKHFLVPVLLLLSLSAVWGQEPLDDTFGCFTSDSSAASATGIDTLKALAVFAQHALNTTKLPVWADSIWDSARQLSVPRYFKDNSLGKYVMTAVASSRNDTTSWTSSSTPIPDPAQGLEGDPVGGNFFQDVMMRVDSVTNFADFDLDQDDVVDACFFIVVNHGGFSGVLLNEASALWEYRTKDTAADGDTIIVGRQRLVLIRSSQEKKVLSLCAHEWGHAIFGPGDWYGTSGRGDWGLGAFSVMGYVAGFPQNIPVPVDPVHRVGIGWVQPITVDTPLYQQSIPDFLTTGTVYKLPHTTAPAQNFYVANYRGADPLINLANIWQVNYSGFGLLIWHAGGPKGIDVELAHGLWDTSPSDSCKTGPPRTENPVSGKDSLDCADILAGIQPIVQSGTCFWNSLPTHNKTTFDGKTNPSSHAKPAAGGLEQTVPTRLAVRRLNTALTAGSPVTADLLVNNWYGLITQNTTWSGRIAVTGDVSIDTGDTLTIQPGTIVYLQRNEDNEKSGNDTTRCEIIVKNGGTLLAIGTAADSIKFVPSPGTPGPYDWHSIRVEAGGSFKAAYCQFKNAYAGIDYRNSATDTVKNCLFENNFMYGVITKNGNVKILNSTFKEIAAGYGVYLDSCSALISGNTITNVWKGINAYKSGSVVTNNIITTTGPFIASFGFRVEGAGQTVVFSYDSVAGVFDEAAVVASGGLAVDAGKIWPKFPSPPFPEPMPQMIGILGLGTATATVRNTTVKMFTSSSSTAPAIKVDGTPVLDINAGCFPPPCQVPDPPPSNRIYRAGTSAKAVQNLTGSLVRAELNW